MKLSRELKVGLLAIVAVTILYFGINFLRGIDFFSPTNTYYAVYDRIDGLAVSNKILINGLTVGRVSEISILQEQGNKLLVELEVENDIVLGDSAVALLVDSDLLGSKGIVLNVGNINRPIQEGDTLIGIVDQTISEAVKETAMPVIENIDSTVSNLNKLVISINANENAINAIFDNLQETSRILKLTTEESSKSLAAISGNLTELSKALSDSETGIAPLLAKLNHMADTLNNLELSQTVANANEAMANIQAVTEKINSGEGSLGKLMNNDSLYTNLNNSAQSLDRLLIDVRENPKKYVHFSVFGGGKDNEEQKEVKEKE